MWTEEVRLSPGLRSASRARGFVGSHLRYHDLPYLVPDVQLVVSELVTNALLHARSPVKVRLEELLASVVLTVLDDSATPPVPRVAAPTDTGGRGLAIVEECSAKWGATLGPHGGKSVWALFSVRQLASEQLTGAGPTTLHLAPAAR